MEGEEEEDFHTIRNEVFGSTMDSGTENDVGNDTVGIIARFAGLFNPEDPQSFMYPKLLHMLGHLHLLFNALETSVKKLEMAAKFFNALRAIESFLSNRQLRRKFQVSCLSTAPPGVSQKFDGYGTVHIDWRCEFLSLALDKLVPLFELLRTSWDEDAVAQGESGDLKRTVIKEMTNAVRMHNFLVFAEMLG